MNKFRTSVLRQFIAVIFLMSALYTQSQILFACDLMDGSPKTECCCGEDMEDGCPMGGGCDNAAGEIGTGCCDISVNFDVQYSVVTLTLEQQLVTQLNASQPPPSLLTTNETHFALYNEASNRRTSNNSVAFWLPGTHTYFVTNRFRI